MPRKQLISVIAVSACLVGLLASPVTTFAASREKVLHNFGPSPDGAYPIANVIFDSAGNLYGTTFYGGTSECSYDEGCGTVFRLTPHKNGQWKEKVLYSFTGGGDGCSPNSLIFDADGNLYGTASGDGGIDGPCGGGTVFELSPGTNDNWTFKVLYGFTDGGDGGYPFGLTFDSSGNLYGTTFEGGASDAGTVFELVPGTNGTWKEKVLHSFIYNGTDGYYPNAGVVLDANGNLYGMTCCGGNRSVCDDGCGTIFEIVRGNNGKWKEKVLRRFNGKDGWSPSDSLILDTAGNLYGTTERGGSNKYGNVFELTPSANGRWREKELFTFSGQSEGDDPRGTLIFDEEGRLYGTTASGGNTGLSCGPYGCGIAFQLVRGKNGKWAEKVLHRFVENGVDGYYPEAGLTFDTAGNLYGTTSTGGSFGETCSLYYRNGDCGTVFEIIP